MFNVVLTRIGEIIFWLICHKIVWQKIDMDCWHHESINSLNMSAGQLGFIRKLQKAYHIICICFHCGCIFLWLIINVLMYKLAHSRLNTVHWYGRKTVWICSQQFQKAPDIICLVSLEWSSMRLNLRPPGHGKHGPPQNHPGIYFELILCNFLVEISSYAKLSLPQNECVFAVCEWCWELNWRWRFQLRHVGARCI